MRERQYTLRFDGLFRGIPKSVGVSRKAGFMCYGWLIYKDGVVIARGHGGYACGNDATSNGAEYLALIEGLEALRDLGIRKEWVSITGDAKSIIEQMQGVATVNSSSIKPLFHRARRLSRWFRNLNYRWTPRRDNKLADLLTRKAMRQIRLDRMAYEATLQAINTHHGKDGDSTKFLPLLDLRVYQPAGL
jgi:ribonuclease HI